MSVLNEAATPKLWRASRQRTLIDAVELEFTADITIPLLRVHWLVDRFGIHVGLRRWVVSREQQ